MEYADRGSLLDSIERRRASEQPFSFDEVVAISRQIAGALEVIHAAGVVHRDLKPSNVLFRSLLRPDADGATERLLLVDFGMAQLDTGGAVSLLGGTPAYAAPEQRAEGGVADARSDLYAAAAITYELLANRPPPRGNSPTEAVEALRRQRPDLPHRLADALVTGLAPDPAQRWQSAARWNEWLGHALTDPDAPTELNADNTFIDRPGPKQPQPAPPEPRARWFIPLPPQWRVPAFAGLGILLIVAAAFLLRDIDTDGTGRGGGETSPSPTATDAPSQEATARPAMTGSPRPTETETPAGPADPRSRLLSWIGASWGTCVTYELPEIYGDYRAAVECDSEGMDAVWYALYDSAEEANAVYSDRLGMAALASGSCPDDAPADGAWQFDGEADNQGRFGCFHGPDTGDAIIVWTIDHAGVLGYALRNDGDLRALVDAWNALGQVRPSD